MDCFRRSIDKDEFGRVGNVGKMFDENEKIRGIFFQKSLNQ